MGGGQILCDRMNLLVTKWNQGFCPQNNWTLEAQELTLTKVCYVLREEVRMVGKGSGAWERSHIWGEPGPPGERGERMKKKRQWYRRGVRQTTALNSQVQAALPKWPQGHQLCWCVPPASQTLQPGLLRREPSCLQTCVHQLPVLTNIALHSWKWMNHKRYPKAKEIQRIGKRRPRWTNRTANPRNNGGTRL